MFGMHAYTSMVMASEAHVAELYDLGRPHTGLRHALRPTRSDKRFVASLRHDQSSVAET